MSVSIKNTFGRALRIGVALVVGLVPLAASREALAASATLSLSPSSKAVGNGGYLTIGIYENSGSTQVNAVEADLSYPATLLTFSGITSSNNFPISAGNSGGGGSVKISRGTSGGETGIALIASVTFKAKVSSGSAKISFTSGSAVVSKSSNKNIVTSKTGGTYTFTSAPAPAKPKAKDAVAPKIYNVAAGGLTFNSATITWNTSEPASSNVSYGIDTKYGLSALGSKLTKDHSITLNSGLLVPSTTYHYLVKSADAAGNVASSKDATFVTGGVSLPVKVTDQKGNAISGAKVTIANKSVTTDSSGQGTFSGMTTGQQFAGVVYKGKSTDSSVDIKNVDNSGQAEAVTLKIKLSDSKTALIAGAGLAAAVILSLLWLLVKHLGGRAEPPIQPQPPVAPMPTAGSPPTTSPPGLPIQPLPPYHVPEPPPQIQRPDLDDTPEAPQPPNTIVTPNQPPAA